MDRPGRRAVPLPLHHHQPTVPGSPQYSVDIWNWKASTDAGSANFAFSPPAGAQAVDPSKLTDTDELPSHLTPKN